jgi:sugar (pentulose or hexulose) kinase
MTIRKHVEDMCNEVGASLDKMIITGGGSNSDLFMQIFADVLNMPVVRNEVNGAAGLGSAICAAVATGVYDSFGSAVEHMVRIRDRFEPIPEHTDVYNRMMPIYHSITQYTDPILKQSYELFE